MRNKKINADTSYTRKILQLDIEYAENIWKHPGDNLVCKVEKILSDYYPKAECTCPLCGQGNKKKGNRPAVFQPTEAGYLFKCLKCMGENVGAITLYNLLLQYNPQMARDYHEQRWIKKLTPFYADKKDAFNIPDFPAQGRKEYYQRKARELKEKNKLEYQRKNGLI